MFFIIGICDGHKELDYDGGMSICKACGAYSRYTVYMTYMYLSLFFIPTIKWNRRYFVSASCCGSVFELDKEKGAAIARGENPSITDEDLTIVEINHGIKRCRICGYETREDFTYCPKCGSKL